MKRHLLLLQLFSLCLLLLGTGEAMANKFHLTVNKVFMSNDTANIYISKSWGYRDHIKSIDMWMYKIADPLSVLNENGLPTGANKLPESVLRSNKVVKKWSQNIGSNQQKVELGKLSAGLYIIDSWAGGERAQVAVVISDYSVTTQTINSTAYVMLSNSQTGRKVDGFQMMGFTQKAKEAIAMEKQEPGLYKSAMVTERYSNTTFIAVKDSLIAVSESYLYYFQPSEETKGYLYTDRPAYRPGQTVYFKGIMRKLEGQKLIPSLDSVTYIVANEKNAEVARKKVAVTALGTFNDSLKIDPSWNLGTYTFSASPNMPNQWYYWSSYPSCTFQIQEYKKPEYEVKVAFEKEQYVLGEEVKATIEANYFFGAPVTNARVEYSLVRERVQVPYWRSFRYWWWYDSYYSHRNEREVVMSETANIDKNGKLSISFKAQMKEGETAKNYKYSIVANVIDASRRYVEGSASVDVSWMPYMLSVYSEQYYYEKGEEAKVIASVTDLNQKPIKQEVQFVVYQNHWRYSNYEQTAIDTFKVMSDPTTGLAILTYPVNKDGSYRIKALLSDGTKSLEEQCSFYVLNENGGWYGWWNQQKSSAVQIMTNKKVYESGEPVKINVMLENEADALITIYNHEVLKCELSSFQAANPPSKEAASGGASKSFEFVLDENTYGAVDISVAYVKNGESYYKSERIMVIPSNQYLNVSLSFDQNEYKPGSWATATVSVTDNLGMPVPEAELSLSTADEAIYFLYPDQSGNIQRSFYEAEDNSSYVTKSSNAYSLYEYSQYVDVKSLLRKYYQQNKKVGPDFFIGDRQPFTWGMKNIESDASNLKVYGFVIDSETKQPLKNAVIKVGGQEFKTNDDGFYAIGGFEKGYADLVFEAGEKSLKIEHVQFQYDRAIYLITQLTEKRDVKAFRRYYSGRDFTKKAATGNLKDVSVEVFGEDYKGFIEAVVEEIEEEMEVGMASDDSWGSSGGGDDFGADRMMASAPISGAGMEKRQKGGIAGRNKLLQQPTVRKDFKDAIYWNPSVRTDARGQAKVRIRLPDNLTTWRTMVRVVTKDTKVGQAFAKTIVRKNLLVRMETPRFITMGDEMLIATTIHNYLSTAKQVTVSLEANGVQVAGTTRKVRIPANGEESIDWALTAPWLLNAKLTVKALTDEESDAMEIKVPTQPNGLQIITAQAAFNQGAGNSQLSFELPNSIDMNTASVELSVVPSVTAALLTSMNDLIGYPYGCVEQTMSRFLPNVLVSNTLKKIGSSYQSNVDQAELTKMVAQGTKRLAELQHSDGGWGWWSNDATSSYYTAYVMFGLHLAKEAGYDIPKGLYKNGLARLASQIKERSAKDDPTLEAYQTMVGQHCGLKSDWQPERLKIDSLQNAYQVSLWMQASVMAGDSEMTVSLQKWLEEKVITSGQQKYWGGQRYYYRWTDDRVETTANVVRALSMIDAKHPMIPAAAQWLLMQRRGGSWHNTRQTAMSIYGLNELIKQELSADATVIVSANGQEISRLNFTQGHPDMNGQVIKLQAATIQASIAKLMDEDGINVLKKGTNTINISLSGTGNAYANAKVSYFLKKDDQQLELLKKDAPFNLERDYFKLKEYKTKDGKMMYSKEAIGKSAIKSGDIILVKAKLEVNDNRDHVLIEDFIPAGCEFIQKADAIIIDGEKEYDGIEDNDDWGWGGWREWYTHKEYRDNRYAMTITNLYNGTQEYSYLLRAQIPGTYQVNPAVAQLMYYPEMRGFSNFETITIEK